MGRPLEMLTKGLTKEEIEKLTEIEIQALIEKALEEEKEEEEVSDEKSAKVGAGTSANPQTLALPFFNAVKVNAGWKCSAYPQYMLETYGIRNAVHYGMDLRGNNRDQREVYASGKGKVRTYGWSPAMGNFVAVEYPYVKVNANESSKVFKGLIARYCHLRDLRIGIYAGMPVDDTTFLGYMGGTGSYGGGDGNRHLHIEFDTDTTYPSYTPSLTSNSGDLFAGTDSTIDPCRVFNIKTSTPHFQSTIKTTSAGWVYSNDVNLPSIK